MPNIKIISKSGKEYIYKKRWVLLDEETYNLLQDRKKVERMSYTKIIKSLMK
jgi:hypothetical protein